MAYMHGIRIQENPTSVPAPVKVEGGVPVIFGTAPVNMAADPENATNRLFLCNTFAEAKAAVGYIDDYSYTLCQAMDAFFKVFGVGPIVICNVLDPNNAKNSTPYTETITVKDGVAVAKAKALLKKDIVIKSGEAALTLNEDYTLSFDEEGYLVVAVLAENIKEITILASQLTPSNVTYLDVIGGIDADTGKETGLELVRKVYPQFGLVPSILLAPGFSHFAECGLMLAAKCNDINGMFQSECIVDISSEAGCTKYTDVKEAKELAGYEDEHMICVWPKVLVAGKPMFMSVIYAAMITYTDYANGNVPNLSPSNKSLKISSTILSDGTEVNLDRVQANELNGIGVVTAINLNGFKAWGNNTSAYPATNDPKSRWIACRRFFTWWGNSFILTYLDKVDDPANYRLVESIVDSENVRGNALVSQGKCAGIKMSYNLDDNPTGNVLAGKVVFRQHLAPYVPAEDILNVLEFDVTMLESALGGE